MKSQNSRNQGLSYYFCLMIEGSGTGSVLLTNRSGSRRLKHLRIRFRNTGFIGACTYQRLKAWKHCVGQAEPERHHHQLLLGQAPHERQGNTGFDSSILRHIGV